MNEAYRVRRPFRWRGWHYGPIHTTNSVNDLGQLEKCDCPFYAGDIWIVEAGHPRKEMMLATRAVIGDASLLSVDDLLAKPEYKRLLTEPGQAVAMQKRELVGAGRGPGRPKKN